MEDFLIAEDEFITEYMVGTMGHQNLFLDNPDNPQQLPTQQMSSTMQLQPKKEQKPVSAENVRHKIKTCLRYW